MAFMNELEKKLNSETQCTENGAVGYRTSGKELLDLNFAVSSMRNWDENEICKQYPEHVDIVTDYGEYSDQEIQMVKGIKRAAEFVQAHHRPMTNAELRKNRAEIKNKGI